MDNKSNIMEAALDPSINDRIAARVRALRADLGLSLDALAAASGVSRSALSLIERAESSPTAVVLDKLAVGLRVPLAALFGDARAKTSAAPLARRAEQPVWKDPGSGYVRRSVTPDGHGAPMQIVEVTFPAGARVAYETGPRDHVVHQQVWVLDGTIEISVGASTHRLQVGDCLAMRLDAPTVFHNPTRKATRYAVVVVAEPSGRRSA